ncbi:aldehyde dehydrogenase family protein [Amycolatopsis pigmentata]|uniref:Aldehyde dehydrogenase family protein n=1 Tax=Amycolatopsis pigmentata TaxID=450801 RepID=A0ABW5FZ50_9PSEU
MSADSLLAEIRLDLPGGGFWNGQWQTDGHWTDVVNQEDGTVVGRVVAATAAEVDSAVRAVAAEVRCRAWPLWQRREALRVASATLAERSEVFARLLCAESSKPIRDARAEVERAVETLRLSSEQASRLAGETLPFDDTPRGAGRRGWYTREPIGVVGAITSFNDPLNLVAHKLGPALIAGNGVVLKPSDHTPLTALLLTELLLQSGVPGSLLAVVAGTGREAGQALVAHPGTDMISFTGGYDTGAAIAALAGPKKLLMELGGNGPVIVLADADLQDAADAIVDGAFNNAGQNCLSVQRIFVERSRYEDLSSMIRARTESLVVGSKSSECTDVGPLIDEKAAIRVAEWVEEAVRDGARILTGGHRTGVLYEPTLLADAPSQSKVLQQEVFGPVATVLPFDGVDEAIKRANDSPYALHAGVFTADLDLALQVADSLDFGAVMINDTGDFRIDAMPFGGRGKRSGLGREGVRYAVESMTEPKIIAIRRGAPAHPALVAVPIDQTNASENL